MGLRLFSSDRGSAGIPAPTDPNPNNFVVKDFKYVNGNTIAVIHYPGCTNFEGTKILVWQGRQPVDTWKRLDPHFNHPATDAHTPFARFRPTPDGIRAAVMLAEALGET